MMQWIQPKLWMINFIVIKVTVRTPSPIAPPPPPPPSKWLGSFDYYSKIISDVKFPIFKFCILYVWQRLLPYATIERVVNLAILYIFQIQVCCNKCGNYKESAEEGKCLKQRHNTVKPSVEPPSCPSCTLLIQKTHQVHRVQTSP